MQTRTVTIKLAILCKFHFILLFFSFLIRSEKVSFFSSSKFSLKNRKIRSRLRTMIFVHRETNIAKSHEILRIQLNILRVSQLTHHFYIYTIDLCHEYYRIKNRSMFSCVWSVIQYRKCYSPLHPTERGLFEIMENRLSQKKKFSCKKKKLLFLFLMYSRASMLNIKIEDA